MDFRVLQEGLQGKSKVEDKHHRKTKIIIRINHTQLIVILFLPVAGLQNWDAPLTSNPILFLVHLLSLACLCLVGVSTSVHHPSPPILFTQPDSLHFFKFQIKPLSSFYKTICNTSNNRFVHFFISTYLPLFFLSCRFSQVSLMDLLYLLFDDQESSAAMFSTFPNHMSAPICLFLSGVPDFCSMRCHIPQCAKTPITRCSSNRSNSLLVALTFLAATCQSLQPGTLPTSNVKYLFLIFSFPFRSWLTDIWRIQVFQRLQHCMLYSLGDARHGGEIEVLVL